MNTRQWQEKLSKIPPMTRDKIHWENQAYQMAENGGIDCHVDVDFIAEHYQDEEVEARPQAN